MSDTPPTSSWLRELSRVSREQAAEEESRLDERWDRLSAGELSPAEEAELRALAETSEEAGAAWEAFRPLGAELRARVVSAAAAELSRPAPESAPREPAARLLPFRRSSLRLGGWLAATAAAAAALLLMVRLPTSGPPLPTYQAELSGGVQGLRGVPAAGPRVFLPGSQLTLTVRPRQAVAGPLEARGFLARGADVVPWEPAPRWVLAPEGAVQVRGTVGEDLRLPTGQWRIWMVVGRKGRLPPAAEIAAALRAGQTRHTGWQAAASEVFQVADRPPP